MREKPQTPAQRVANPVWLRAQIERIVGACDASIEEAQALADKAYGDHRNMYLARVEIHQHWKQQLERVLRGKTLVEEIAKDLKQAGIHS